MHIVIYSTTNCAACHSLAGWLDKQGQAYTIRVVDTDPLVMKEFLALSKGRIGVPFSVLTDKDGTETTISGFDLPRFKSALRN